MSGPANSRRIRRRVVALATASLVGTALVGAPAVAAPAATIPTPHTCYAPLIPGNPVITSFKLSPGKVTVTGGAKKIALTAIVQDTGPNAKNVRFVSASFQSPRIGGVTRSVFASLTLKSGTTKNGTWKASLMIPQWTNSGTWKVGNVALSDAGGGFAYYSPTGGTHPWGGSWSKNFAVVSSPDVTAPALTKFSLSRKSVSTVSGAAKITVSATATDARSGARYAFATAYYTPSKGISRSASVFMTKTGGTRTNAKLSGILLIPRWMGAGTHSWKIQTSVVDGMSNVRSYSPARLTSKKFIHSLSVKSASDNTKPTISTESFTPKTIDVRGGAKSVTVSINAKDTKSGVAYLSASFTSPLGQVRTGYLTKTSGSLASGKWKGRVMFEKCTPDPGIWKLSITAVDLASNYTTVKSTTLIARHLPVNLTVNSYDRFAPQASAPTAKVAKTGGVVLTFNEPTLWTGLPSSLLTIAGGSPYNTVAGTWSCKNSAGAVVACNTNGANVKTVLFSPTTAFDVGSRYYINSSAIHPAPIGIYDTSGNPLSYLYASFTT